MSGATAILLLSLLVQFLVERIKVFQMPEAVSKWAVPLIALIISLLLTIGCQIGILSLFSITINPLILDYILTGIAISGGSTLVNELIKTLQGLKETFQSNQ